MDSKKNVSCTHTMHLKHNYTADLPLGLYLACLHHELNALDVLLLAI